MLASIHPSEIAVRKYQLPPHHSHPRHCPSNGAVVPEYVLQTLSWMTLHLRAADGGEAQGYVLQTVSWLRLALAWDPMRRSSKPILTLAWLPPLPWMDSSSAAFDAPWQSCGHSLAEPCQRSCPVDHSRGGPCGWQTGPPVPWVRDASSLEPWNW